MASVSKVLRSVDLGGGRRGLMYWCPACDGAHAVCVDGAAPRWSFNGDVDRPTFSPSVKVVGGARGSDHVCHHFVEAGIIKYCADSTHALAGQSIDLPPHAIGDSPLSEPA